MQIQEYKEKINEKDQEIYEYESIQEQNEEKIKKFKKKKIQFKK